MLARARGRSEFFFFPPTVVRAQDDEQDDAGTPETQDESPEDAFAEDDAELGPSKDVETSVLFPSSAAARRTCGLDSAFPSWLVSTVRG